MEPSISRADLGSFQSTATITYKYQPLSSATRQTRVLILYPSHNWKADLHCDLFTLDLDHYAKQGLESYPYLALSYVWGETVPQKMIVLGGKKKKVNPNLFGLCWSFEPQAYLCYSGLMHCVSIKKISKRETGTCK